MSNNGFKSAVFLEPPADFFSIIEVATCYVRSGDKLLFVKRRPDKTQGSMWGIPGGKVDKKKVLSLNFMREITEETALDFTLKPIKALGSVYIRYPNCDYTYHMFGVLWESERPEIVLNPDEHVDYAWWSLKEGLSHSLILFEEACTFLVWNNPFFDGCEKPLLHVPARI